MPKGKRDPHNIVRFIPGRRPRLVGGRTDDRLMLTGARYSRAAMDTPKGFVAGIAVGPGIHKGNDDAGIGFQLSEGGIIVPALPNEKLEPVPVRDYPYRDDHGTKRTKQYIDLATFKRAGTGIFNVVPYEEENVVYFEVWTGDVLEEEATFQLVQADVFHHGSVEFSGGDIVIDAPSKKRAKKDEGGGSVNIRESSAELVAERVGPTVGGIELWRARLWRVRYSDKDSEAVLVRQMNRFFLLSVENGEPTYVEVPADKFEKRYEILVAAVEAKAA